MTYLIPKKGVHSIAHPVVNKGKDTLSLSKVNIYSGASGETNLIGSNRHYAKALMTQHQPRGNEKCPDEQFEFQRAQKRKMAR